MVKERENILADKKLGREGHRARLRQQYLLGGMDNAPDHNLLEIFLSIMIPRRDVKDLSYELINTFGSLEGVINASPQELMTVKGIGESTAVALSSVKKINDRIIKNRNSDVKRIITLDDAKRYCINELSTQTVEKVVQINLKNNGAIINTYLISEGSVNCTNVDTGKIIKNAAFDNAAYVLIAHNHPSGETSASGSDIDFTLHLRSMLKSLNAQLIDHLIVAGDSCECILHNPMFQK